MRSEDYLTSPLQIDSPRDRERWGVSIPIDSPEIERNGDRTYTVRAPRTHGGKDVAVSYVRRAIDSTGGAAPKVHWIFGTSVVISLGFTVTRGRPHNRETRLTYRGLPRLLG